MTAPSLYQLDQVVNLDVRWGTQVRHKCVVCKHFITSDAALLACKCGAHYRPLSDGTYEIRKLP